MHKSFTGFPGVCTGDFTDFTQILVLSLGEIPPSIPHHLPPCLSFPKPPFSLVRLQHRTNHPTPHHLGGCTPKKTTCITFLALSHQFLELLGAGAGAVPLLLHLCQPPAQRPHLHPQLLLRRQNGVKKGFFGGMMRRGKGGRTRSRCASCSSRRKSRRAARTASGSLAASGSGGELGVPGPSPVWG